MKILKSLQALNQRYDVVLVQVLDPIEKSLPDTGLIDVVDIESGQWMSLDAGSPQWQQFQRQEHQQWLDDVAERSARAELITSCCLQRNLPLNLCCRLCDVVNGGR